MSQTITTTHSAALPNGNDLTEDSPAIAAAVISAIGEAVELGGHQQRVIGISVSLEEQVEVWAGLVAPLAVVRITTQLT